MFSKGKKIAALELENAELRQALANSEELERQWESLLLHFGLDTDKFKGKDGDYLWEAISDGFDPMGRLLRKNIVITTNFEGHDFSESALAWVQVAFSKLMRRKALVAGVNSHLAQLKPVA
ncbi:hypothetical protein RYA05_02375 [Pseudomonas syringae pv. actinidiae]|nr:hypothetical protein [Pseudomonas syringae pv. actinidiae]